MANEREKGGGKVTAANPYQMPHERQREDFLKAMNSVSVSLALLSQAWDRLNQMDEETVQANAWSAVLATDLDEARWLFDEILSDITNEWKEGDQ